MISIHPLRRPGRKRLLPVIASIILFCFFCFSAEAAAAENDINGYLLSDIGLTYAEINEKYGVETNISGFEGELFAEFERSTYSFRPGGTSDAAYSGEGPFDVVPKDDAVCYAIDTTAGALFPWLAGSCSVSELAARGFSASAASAREAAFAGVIEGAFCHFVYGDCVIDVALGQSGSGAADAFSVDSDAFIMATSSVVDAGGERQNDIFGEWAKTDNDYPYENLTKFCLYPDYTFKATVNLLERIGFMSGVYSIDGDTVRCTVLSKDYDGYTGADMEQFELSYSGGSMLYLGAYMGDLYSFEGPVVLEKIRTYPNEPTSPDGGETSEPGPFEPYTLELHCGCPIYDQPSSKAGTVTAYIDPSTLYTIVEEATDEYGVTWGRLKSGVGWICLPASSAVEKDMPPSGESRAELAYAQILSEYRQACEADAYDEEFSPILYPDVNETMMEYYHYLPDSGSGFYFCYKDINADCANELLIGCGADDYISICDLYLFDGTRAVKAIENDTLGDRTRLTLYENGTLLEEGSNGAASGSAVLYRVGISGADLDVIFAYDYDYDENGSGGYYDTYGACMTADDYYALLNEQTNGQAEVTAFSWELLAGPWGG